ncbi:GNAT family N-acetyltransferase [Tropicibacter sp. S64]|uniref:GNAT family N-acetyltransferase n=1 Tax=Tropicibacter sp. S64 TaxID=3415122 RepID=UPI003C7AAF96
MATVVRVRGEDQIAAASALVWEFFDTVRVRYPDMQDEIDAYIADQDVKGQLANFEAFFLPPRGECFLAEHEGQTAGIVMLRPAKDGDGEMNRMYVREAFRGLGLGRLLCVECIAESRRLGHGTLWLDALYRHVEALPLYESLGFQRYTDPDAYGGDDTRVIHMKLRLT